MSDGLAWVSGMPVSILGKIEGVSVDQVDILIQDGEKLKTDLTGKLTPELQKVLDAEISKLYEKKAFLLGNISLVIPNGNQKQRKANYAAVVALNASIRENPEAYLERIKKLESDVE